MLAVLLASTITAAPTLQASIERFASSWRGISFVTYRLQKRERLRDGEVVEEAIRVKLRREPLAVYIAAELPRPGQEIIFDSAKDPARFIVHRGRFPDLTVRLSLVGGLATARQHHLVSHSGFGYILALLERVAGSPGTTAGPVVAEPRGRRLLWRLDLVPPAPVRVSAAAGDSVFAFAERLGADPYYLYYSNPAIADLTDPLPAGTYLVPVGCGARLVAWLDDETGLPVEVEVHDREGRLYEHLQFTAVVVGAALTAIDFDPENPAYGF